MAGDFGGGGVFLAMGMVAAMFEASRSGQARWSTYRQQLGELFATRTQDEWAALLDGVDDTVMPVLDLEEAPGHPQNVERGAFVEVEGTVQPAPAPRFSRTPSEVRRVSPRPGQGGDEALRDWGFPPPRRWPACARRAPSAEPPAGAAGRGYERPGSGPQPCLRGTQWYGMKSREANRQRPSTRR